MKTIFSDKASIVIRAMLNEPNRRWTVRDFENEFNIGRSRSAELLSSLRRKGYVGGIPSGRLAYSILINKKELLEEWSKIYSFKIRRRQDTECYCKMWYRIS